jgi:hypothetical protein
MGIKLQTYRLQVPVTIAAIQITRDNIKWIANWCGGTAIITEFVTALDVRTLTGTQRAFEGWYVIRTRPGDYQIMAGKSFEEKYELNT